jgi:hypothetical protein
MLNQEIKMAGSICETAIFNLYRRNLFINQINYISCAAINISTIFLPAETIDEPGPKMATTPAS